MTPLDAELLDRLWSALQIAAREPTAGEVSALRKLVRDDPALPATVVGIHDGPQKHRVRRVTLAAVFAATLLIGSGAVAMATNGPFSGTARRAASALGLPVDSPELSSAKNALAALRGALAGHDDRQIADARHDVDRRVAALSGDDARDVGRNARDLLREADERLGSGHDQREQGPSGTGRGDGGGASTGDRAAHDRGGSRGPGGGTESNPNLGPSHSGSGSDGGGGATPTTLPGGSGSGDDGGSSGGGSSSGGSGSDGGSGSGH